MSVRRSIVVLTLLVLGLPTALFYARANRTDNSAAPQELQQYTVVPGTVELTVSAVGSVRADQVTRLSFTTTGRVVELPFAIGDAVLQGDMLARQDDSDEALALEQAQLALDMAQLQEDRLLAGPDAGQIAVAEANVAAAQGAVASVANAVSDADLQAAELAYAQAQQAVEDATQARATAPGDQAPEAYALLDARVGQASFNAEIARLQLEALRSGNQGQLGAASARVAQAQRELERLLAGPTQAEIDRAAAQTAQAQIQVEQAQTALDRTRLTAPFDGVISAINVEIGSLTAPGVVVIELTDLNPLRLTVQVDEIDIRQIAEGMTARVRVDALPDVELPAVLEQVSLVANNQQGIINYDVEVRLEAQDARVRIGMTAEASVVIEQRNDVLVVPNEYIRLDRQSGEAFVNLLRADGALEEVPIVLGLQGPDVSEVIDGLRAGDVVAVDLAGDTLNLFGG